MSTNGLISFGRSVSISSPTLFPSTDETIFWSYIVAPFWANFDTTLGGSVKWEIHQSSSSANVMQVSHFIQSQYEVAGFIGSWMLVGSWENMQPSDVSYLWNLMQCIAYRLCAQCFDFFYIGQHQLPSYFDH